MTSFRVQMHCPLRGKVLDVTVKAPTRTDAALLAVRRRSAASEFEHRRNIRDAIARGAIEVREVMAE
jgi:hypothetical protein